MVLSSLLIGLQEALHCSSLQSEELIFLKCQTLWNLHSQRTPVCFWVLLGVRKCRKITLAATQRGSFVVCFFFKSCLRFLTEESVWPPGCNCQPLQPLEERVSLSKPSAHIYCLSSSLWSSHPPADWCWSEFEGRGPPHAGPGSGFSTEGRISLSKCLAGKYVTRLVNDLALYR